MRSLLVVVYLTLVILGLVMFYLHRGEGFDAGEHPLPVLNHLYGNSGTSAVRTESHPPHPPGDWSPARDGGARPGDDELENLRSLGYLSGSEEAPVVEGVTIYDPERAFEGYNLITSGHAPGVMLVDMEGNVVHEWYTDVYRMAPWPHPRESNMDMQYWTRATLFDNGDVIVLCERLGIFGLDKDSNILWTSGHIESHHDFDVGPDGRIYAMCSDVYIDDDYNPYQPIADNFVRILGPTGNLIRTISIRDALASSPYAPILTRLPPAGDILHGNTVEYIRGDRDRIAPLREGTLLLSFRTPDLVCALDPQTENIYWAESDLWAKQHQPTLLRNGNILVFDNCGRPHQSTVLEFDPSTRRVEWFYRGTEEEPFFSLSHGSCQRLPNGNTLITESNQGRVFEVTPDKEIVWEYVSPFRAGENRELIAQLFPVLRVPPERVNAWLNADPPGPL
ncbi:hypothetical protein GF402_01270 [Candidatus Fermentibacteria bacterium]|nr:hypothetical protein [Candidatus Fermentibacteria bacterium]